MTSTALTATTPAGLSTLSTSERARDAWATSLDNANTRAAYLSDWQQFATWCAEQGGDPLTVNRRGLDTYRQHLAAEGRAASTIARKLAAVSSFYEYAIDLELLEVNPCARVKRPRVSRQSPTLGMSAPEAAAFLAAAEHAGPRDYALACLLVLNGLRVSEALAVRLEAITSALGHTVVEVTGKGDKARTVVLAPQTVHAITTAAQGRTSGPVLVDGAGEPLNRHQVARIVRRLATRAGVSRPERITPHSCRHTFVTLSLEAGVPLHQVQDDAGHESPETTRRYDLARNRLEGASTYALASALAR